MVVEFCRRYRWWLIGGVYLILFTAGASEVFLRAEGLTPAFGDDFTYPWRLYQWWVYLFCCQSYPTVWPWLSGAGLVAAAAPPGLVWLLAMPPRASRVTSAAKPTAPLLSSPFRQRVTDEARWGTFAEAREIYRGPNPSHGGIVVGEAYDPRTNLRRFFPHRPRTWGQGGKAPLLIDPCEEGSTHSLRIAGSGFFKTVSCVSTGLTWTGSMVALDPALELYPMLREARLAMGHTVHIIDPEEPDSGFDVLGWIDIHSSAAEMNLNSVVEWICGHTTQREGAHSFWKDRGKALVTCLLANLLWDSKLPSSLKKLDQLRPLLSVGKDGLLKMLKVIHTKSESTMAKYLAGDLLDAPEETFGSICQSAANDTKWLTTEAYARLVSGDSFKASDLVNGKTDVFLELPLKTLEATPAIARCILGALINAVYEARGATKTRILFLVDEAASVPMRTFSMIMKDGRKFGITLHLLFQSISQIEQGWGREGKDAWLASVSWYAFGAAIDPHAAKELSEVLDDLLQPTVSQTRRVRRFFAGWQPSDRSETMSERWQRLMRIGQLMFDLPRDAQIVIPKGNRPILCGLPIYFRRPEFAKLIRTSRFTKRP